MSEYNRPILIPVNFRNHDDNNHVIDTSQAKRAQSRPPVVRRIKGYVAYDLHSLLEHESESDRARPGHIFG